MLSDIQFKGIYRSDRNDMVEDFYLPALKEAKRYMRSVAYFTSSALLEIAKGLDEMVSNGGFVQLIVSPKLNEEDINAIKKGYEIRDVLQNAIDSLDIIPCNIFEEERLNYVATLVAENRLDIKIAFLSNGTEYGIYHEKIGIIKDECNNAIVFTGSINETYSAQRVNFESFHVFRS